MRHFRLQGKTALVTGAGLGIGRGIALRLAQDGADVVINDINSSDVDSVVKEVRGLGRKSLGIVADVTKRDEVYAMVDKVVDEFGQLDVMVANAGIAQVKPALDLTEEDWDSLFAVNAKGVFFCDQAAAKHMVEEKSGKIINCACIAGHSGFALLSHYSATKFAVRGFTQALAKELRPFGIQVNAYCPGIVGTAMWDLVDEEMGKQRNLPKGETLKKYSEIISAGCVETPDDVAAFVAYLASEDSDYMTGQSVMIDGGIIMN
jgi:meso-butanediol dehydrogenase/(S,S)-butanediol dehydrogenase/diacetyl reductase